MPKECRDALLKSRMCGCVFARQLKSHDVKGTDLLLVIEVSDASLPFDLGKLHARYGTRELWVVDVKTRSTSVHTRPSGAGWTTIRTAGADDLLTSSEVSAIQLRIGELNLE